MKYFQKISFCKHPSKNTILSSVYCCLRIISDIGSLIIIGSLYLFNSLYSQSSQGYTIIPIPGNINTQMQEFGPCLTPDGKTLYFYSKRKSQYTDIYKSNLVNGKWSNPVEVKEINSPYDDQSPFIYGNEKFMIFSSNRDGSTEFQMPNGQVGISRDLYYSERVGGEWTQPANLSEVINTEEMEENPSIHGDYLYFTRYPFGNPGLAKIYRSLIRYNEFLEPEELPYPINQKNTSTISATVSPDGKYLYFSSNRPGGYGGYDIYRSKIFENGKFGEPENLGSEINTDGSEAYFIINPIDDTFLFCRKKQDDNYDIYIAIKIDKEKTADPAKPIVPNVPLKKGQSSPVITTNSKKEEPNDKIINLSQISKKISPEDTFTLQKKVDKDIENFTDAIKEKKKITINSIYFDTNSPSLLPDSFPILNALTEILQVNKNVKIKITGHTDLTGDLEENKKLSWERSEAVKKFLTNKGIETSRILIDGKGSTQPLINSKTPEASRVNRRTEFEVID